MELIVVLFLMALIVGLTMPTLLSTLEKVKAKESVNEIATLFRFARSKAISEKIPYSFNANIDTNQYWLTNLDTEDPSEIRNLSPKLKIIEFSDSEETISDGPFFIIFFPQGNSSGGSLFMESSSPKSDSITFSITLDPITGKPYVQETKS